VHHFFVDGSLLMEDDENNDCLHKATWNQAKTFMFSQYSKCVRGHLILI
jgi:hypothetical protein